ncbi:hypothetical protein [Burkholderia sp. Ac-20349]|uniref:hypothetical protein n=1 Tax=Burkholderia sp. Ac-20349 TaxID=2703893 RepID=UPI00197C51A7|nr:hypothetical protein [Burkholderia sp. Ac-20349]MBN3839308.1 hypothetical protein [Burkholderia sp. Ac-20349]
MSGEFKARIGRDVPKQGEIRVVFSMRTARGNLLELDGVVDEDVALKAWNDLYANQAKRRQDGRQC